jgi:hypothetical protein
MTPFVGNYSPEELEAGRKAIAETSPQQIELLYRTGKINLPDKIQMLRGYGQMKRELQIRDMSAAGTGGAMGEIKQYAIGVMQEGAKAWESAVKLWQSDQGLMKTAQPPPQAKPGEMTIKGQPLPDLTKQFQKSKGALVAEVVFHGLMTGLEGLKAYDIPGNIIERWSLEAGFDPSYARAANWAAWIPANFFGISNTLKLPMKAAGAGIRAERKALAGANKALTDWTAWLKDPVGEATKSAMKLNEKETAQILGQLDQAIMQSETGQALKKVAEAASAAEKIVKESVEVSTEVVKPGVTTNPLADFMEGVERRWNQEQAGQSVLDFLEETGRTPQQVVKDFWEKTYDNLPPEVQKRFQQYIKRETSLEPGAVVATGPSGNVTAKSWRDVYPHDTPPIDPTHLEGTERGLISLMEMANRGAGKQTAEGVAAAKMTPLLEGAAQGTSQQAAGEGAAAGAREGMEGLVEDVIPSPDAFEKAAISDLIKFYEQKAQAYVRKGISHAQTEKEAVGKMSFEELINRPPGQAMSAAELAYTGRVNDAIRNGLENTIKDALPHLDDIQAGKRGDLTGLFKAHFSAFAQTNPVFLGASGEVGRGLEFMKVLQPEVQAARMYDNMLKALGSDMLAESSDAAIAKSLLKLSVLEKDARKAFLDAGKADTSPSIWHSLYKSLLFIVPATHVANFAGQNQGAVLQLMQHTGAALAGGEGAPALQGAWAAWKGYGSAWMHLPRIMRIASERSMESLDKLGLEGAKDTIARYGPARWLGFGDELVGAALEQGFAKEELINRGLEKGLIGKSLADFVNEQSAIPSVVKDIEETVQPIVQHAMFHDSLSPIGEANAKWLRNSIFDLWLPVVKFPINSLKMARDWTPGLQFVSTKFVDDLAAGGAREAEARSRVTLSWMMSNYLWGEAKAGNCTGGGPVDPEKNAAWRAGDPEHGIPGNIPYSVHRMPYRWAEPVGTVIGAVCDMAYFSNQMDPDDVEDFAAGLGVSLSRMIENNWWLRSMEGVTGMVSSMHSAQKTTEFFKAAAQFFGAPFITVATGGPLGGKIREIRDPEVKQINGFADYFLAKTPWYGLSKDVAPLLNYSGQPKLIPPVLGHRWLNLILPSGLRGEGTKDPVGAFLYKHGLELPDNWKTFGGADDERPFFEPGQGKLNPALNSNESHNWKLLSLTDAKRYDGRTWVEKILQLDNDAAFNDKSRYQKQKQVSLLYENYRDKGKKLLSAVDPEVALKVEIAKQKTKEIRGKMPADVGNDLDTQPEDTEVENPPVEQTPIMELQETPAAEQNPPQ